MRDRVHESLEHRTLAELRPLGPRGCLGRTDQHVPAHEMQRLRNLLVERPFNVARVDRIVDIGPLARIADRLYVSMEQPPLRLARAQQRTGEREPRCAVLVVGYDAELARRFLGDAFVGEIFSQEATRQRAVQIARGRIGRHRLVESNQPALAAFLKQSRQDLRSHFTLRAAEAAEAPTRAPVYEEAPRNLHANDRDRPAIRIFQLHFAKVGIL